VEAVAPVTPRAGSGTGAVEAPRGLLVHSYCYDDAGRLVTADVVTPTALNAASVEHRLRAAVEQSASREPDDLKPKLEMVVRAYDPCISCAVHVLDRRRAP
jgi:sulfhydrogenase subunit alpha